MFEFFGLPVLGKGFFDGGKFLDVGNEFPPFHCPRMIGLEVPVKGGHLRVLAPVHFVSGASHHILKRGQFQGFARIP